MSAVSGIGIHAKQAMKIQDIFQGRARRQAGLRYYKIVAIFVLLLQLRKVTHLFMRLSDGVMAVCDHPMRYHNRY